MTLDGFVGNEGDSTIRPASRRRWSGAGRVARSAGRARVGTLVEAVEPRVLLAGDHPSFSDFPNATAITLTGGEGSVNGLIETAGSDDLFRFEFTGSQPDFVTVLADTLTVAGGSTLDSRVQVYTNESGVPTLVGSAEDGRNNGQLTGGLLRDGWRGFIAQPGTTYFVRVLSDAATGAGSTGGYTVRVDTTSTAATLTTDGAPLLVNGTLARVGQDIVYRVTTPNLSIFDSLFTANARAVATVLNTRIDVYDSNGLVIAFDSESGRLSNAFATFKSLPNTTYYLRVRADEFLPGQQTTGAFTLALDGASTPIALEPVARTGTAQGTLANGSTTEQFIFTAQGSGRTIISLLGVGMTPLPDPALHVYSDFNNQPGVISEIAFNQDFIGFNAQIEIDLVGGRRYWILVEGFSVDPGGMWFMEVESHHTFDASQPIDDHPLGPNDPNPGEEGFLPAYRAAAEFATPIPFGAPGPRLDGMGTPIGDHSQVQVGTFSGRIYQPGDRDLFMFHAPMDMLGFWQGERTTGTPPQWQANKRTATRLEIQVSGSTYLNSQVRVLDSQFNVVYDVNDDMFVPPPLEPAGMWDPSAYPPDDPALIADAIGITVWGGETYYIEVLGNVTGRFQGQVIVDAFPALGPNGRVETLSTFIENPEEGQFNLATQLNVDPNGDSRNAFGDQDGRRPFRLYQPPQWVLQQRGDLGVIESLTDSDVYQFTAPFSGTVEVRINTTRYQDRYFHRTIDNRVFPPVITDATRSKVVSSRLDAALRVFRNDLTQVGYNNDNPALSGVTQTTFVGALGDREFQRRDPRVVVPIEQGQRYFIVIESGQRWSANAQSGDPAQRTATGADLVDWRTATGGYELLLHTMPALQFVDDHVNGNGNPNIATVVPIGLNGAGTISGQIVNTTPINPVDTDLFTFIAPASGPVTLTLTRGAGNPVNGVVTLLDRGFSPVSTAGMNSSGVATVSGSAVRGERFWVRVEGAAGSQGRYDLAVQTGAVVDDFADSNNWFGAAEIPTLPFLGSGTATGSLEEAGDSDVFRVSSRDFATFTVTVTATDLTLNPTVRVYEVQEDRTTPRNAVFQQIAFNRDISATDLNARIAFPLSPSRVSGTTPNRNYPFYYIVVEGENRSADFGRYTVSISFDRTDDHPDQGQFDQATPISVPSPSGVGSITGRIELAADTDLFRFTSPAGGSSTVTIGRPTGSTLRMGVTILLGDGTQLGAAQAPDSSVFVAPSVTFSVTRGTVYFVLVRPVAPNTQTTITGDYNVNVTAPPVDDHPNAQEWGIATPVPLNPSTGLGQVGSTTPGVPGNPQLFPSGDTDLFTFAAVGPGNVIVTVQPLLTALGQFAGRLTVFNADQTVNQVVTGTQALQSISVTVTGAAVGASFFVLVESVTLSGATRTGEYVLQIAGAPASGGGGGGQNPGEINFQFPTILSLSSRTGDGQFADVVERVGDRDLFTFTTLAAGRTFVQLLTPAGTPLQARITLLNAPSEGAVVAADESGFPGVRAALTFNAAAATQYWVIVTGLAGTTGSYTLRVDSLPTVNTLVFPEGFANERIRQFISISNDNDTTVSYTVSLRYEDGGAPTVLPTSTIPARTRGGLTISNAELGALPGVRLNTPYSVVIESSLPIGATFAHYDSSFDVSTGGSLRSSLGESFTERTSASWSFARVEKNPGAVASFLLAYNPNNFDVRLSLRAFTPEGVVTVLFGQSGVLGANRRGGFNIADIPQLPAGVYGVILDAAPVDSANQSAFVGVVAALSQYETVPGRAFGFNKLGNADGGATRGTLMGVLQGPTTTSTITLFNALDTKAVVTLTGRYTVNGLPTLSRTIEIDPRSTTSLDGASLGIVADQPLGLSFASNQPVNVMHVQRELGEGDAQTYANAAATEWFLGDLFINTFQAGQLYFETLHFHNPTAADTTINVQLLFSDGAQANIPVAVAARGYAKLDLHDPRQAPQIVVDRPGANYFSVRASAVVPFSMLQSHYDLFLGGGWKTAGKNFGPLTPFNLIP